ncbi:MAG: FkbM family methyltransferase [Actinomycetia bacterium]|nr:FkbM family methyltransferase [Actinomycetes bacterium]
MSHPAVARLVNILVRAITYGSFLATHPRWLARAVTRGRQPGFHLGELIKLARASAVLDISQLATIIDVGANRGQLSLTARALQPGLDIIAVEPLASCAEPLRLDLERTGGGVVHQVIVGAESVDAVPFYESAQDKSSSALPMSDTQRQQFPWTAPVAVHHIRQATLDELTSSRPPARPALLKLDVQGAELNAIAGAPELLEMVDFVLAEVGFSSHYDGQPRPQEIIAALAEHGFEVGGVVELLERPAGGVVEADLLFRRAQQ